MKSTKLAAVCILATCMSHAQVSFVISGQSTTSTFDYSIGQPVSFTFTLQNGFDYTTDSSFSSSDNNWNEEDSGHDQLWAAVTGTGISGTYTRPVTTFIDPSSALAVHSTGAFGVFQINAGADEASSNIGLTVASGSIRRLQVNLDSGGPSFAFSGSYNEPSSFFDNYTGSYAVTGQISLLAGVYSEFTATSLTIIPEPSNAAFGVGLAGLLFGTLTIRKRRIRA